jgi:hypothetical protein
VDEHSPRAVMVTSSLKVDKLYDDRTTKLLTEQVRINECTPTHSAHTQYTHSYLAHSPMFNSKLNTFLQMIAGQKGGPARAAEAVRGHRYLSILLYFLASLCASFFSPSPSGPFAFIFPSLSSLPSFTLLRCYFLCLQIPAT